LIGIYWKLDRPTIHYGLDLVGAQNLTGPAFNLRTGEAWPVHGAQALPVAIASDPVMSGAGRWGSGMGRKQARVEPNVGLMAGRGSPEDPICGGTVEAEVPVSARPGKRQVVPVVRLESTGMSRGSLWMGWRHRTAAGDLRALVSGRKPVRRG
jgi:hypothetical protein